MNRPRGLIGTAMLLVGLGAIGLSACNRPSEASCKKAIANVAKIMGTEHDKFAEKPDSAIRSCRGNATKKDVKCMIAAKSEADLIACEGGVFEKLFGADIKKQRAKQKPEPDSDQVEPKKVEPAPPPTQPAKKAVEPAPAPQPTKKAVEPAPPPTQPATKAAKKATSAPE